jgi:hypothetical protein
MSSDEVIHRVNLAAEAQGYSRYMLRTCPRTTPIRTPTTRHRRTRLFLTLARGERSQTVDTTEVLPSTDIEVVAESGVTEVQSTGTNDPSVGENETELPLSSTLEGRSPDKEPDQAVSGGEEGAADRRLADTHRESPRTGPATIDRGRPRSRRTATALTINKDFRDRQLCYKISMNRPIRERGEAARSVIEAEVQQNFYSSMFIKDKFTASGDFDKSKAREPVVAYSSITGQDRADNGHRRSRPERQDGLDRNHYAVPVKLDSSYQRFVERNGTCMATLDKVLYGCVEAAALWYEDLTRRLREDGFVANIFDPCVLNKLGKDGKQIIIVLHADDLFITCETQFTLDKLSAIGVTFDFTTEGEVRVTMDNCTADIISGCG